MKFAINKIFSLIGIKAHIEATKWKKMMKRYDQFWNKALEER